jgi:hypothetical protein
MINVTNVFVCVCVCVCSEGPRSRYYGRNAALRLIVQPCDEGDSFFFSFFLVIEHRWNEIDREKPKYSRKNLSQCQFVHHKSHMDWPGIEPSLRGERPATNRLSHGTALCSYY